MFKPDPNTKIVLGMVGLPARGKTYIARKLARYLIWLGYNVKTFNIGNYRRKNIGTTNCNADFFNHNNEEARKQREECAMNCLDDLLKFLNNGGDVAIYDGTNTTRIRRLTVKKYIEESLQKVNLIWVESICNDEELILQNIIKAKLNNPDYVGIQHEKAIQDFQDRINQYKKVYQEIDQEEYPNIAFIKYINVGKSIHIYNIQGYLQSKILSYIMNMKLQTRPIFLVRTGITINELEMRLGEGSEISPEGNLFTQNLNLFCKNEVLKQTQQDQDPMGQNPVKKERLMVKIFTSTQPSCIQTAKNLKFSNLTQKQQELIENDQHQLVQIQEFQLKILDSLSCGNFDGLTIEELKQQHPDEYEKMLANPYYHRFPGGENYQDLIERIEPIIYEIERSSELIVVIAGVSILKCLYAYYHKNDNHYIPYIQIPNDVIIKLVPDVYSCSEIKYTFDPSLEEKFGQEQIQKAGIIEIQMSSEQKLDIQQEQHQQEKIQSGTPRKISQNENNGDSNQKNNNFNQAIEESLFKKEQEEKQYLQIDEIIVNDKIEQSMINDPSILRSLFNHRSSIIPKFEARFDMGLDVSQILHMSPKKKETNNAIHQNQ